MRDIDNSMPCDGLHLTIDQLDKRNLLSEVLFGDHNLKRTFNSYVLDWLWRIRLYPRFIFLLGCFFSSEALFEYWG